MRDYGLEVFKKTSDYSELRFRDSDELRTRGLDTASIDDLVATVKADYDQDSAAPKVFSSDQLLALGERLYLFLDGDERWFVKSLSDPPGATLRITAEERLRHLPWELMVQDGAHLAVNATVPFTPVRSVRTNASVAAGGGPANRPLRVLFMATSPEGVKPVLGYEAEEALILTATTETGTELVVEESGTLDGLRFIVESYGPGYFDVLHLSGHADINDSKPVFIIEDELGGPALASPDDIASAVAGNWPRLVFVSGCLTGNAPRGGTVPSMSESLVRAGAPAVLGWALPVGDVAASFFASFLYRGLAAGQRLDEAVARARQQLHGERSRNWHLLRMYSDASPLTPLVTVLNHPDRARIKTHRASTQFLDPETQKSRVAAREEFIGRRRVIQRCLRTLKEPLAVAESYEGIVLQGMGGLGKSTLASRLLERMPTHQRAVWFGAVDETEFAKLTSKVTLNSFEDAREANRILGTPGVDLETRLRYLFNKPLQNLSCLFVFDDFEHGNLEERDGGHVLSESMSNILPALLNVIRETNNPSRVIITSRYEFPIPVGTRLRVEALETLNEIELDKKLMGLPQLRPGALINPEIQQRAITAAGGNPRLLEWLDRVVADAALDVPALIGAIEGEANRFRKENIFAEKLLDAQPDDLQKMLAQVNVVELPVPAETVYAVHDHPDTEHHIRRASELGLLEEGTDPETGEHRYFVSNVLRPLLSPHLTNQEYQQACAAAAASLYELWVQHPPNNKTENTDEDQP